ncbi:hypothetical protein [Aquibacillus salsiterrae]|uniref:DUF4129 domain-containing protein n=1 Tax=Aquibacillus salsiterrae TaxID=2950439 RepID=A0A9X4AFS9_9BACI|nr:hypothetical protein [Aquibacillus salsiterrae]MDC3417969.1 hypothetical protein [Aquibacillus salsiterrae]
MRNIFSRTLEALVEFLVLFPVILMIGVLLQEYQLVVWLLQFPVLMMTGLLFRLFIKQKKEWVYVAFSLFMTLLSLFLLFSSILTAIVALVLGFTLTYRASRYAVYDKKELFPSSYLWVIGLPIYVIGYVVFRYKEELVNYLSIVSFAGFILLIVTLLSANDEHLKAATLSKKARPMLTKNVIRQNRLFIIITIVFALLVANLQAIQAFIQQAIYQTIKGIVWLLTLNGNDESPPEQPPKAQQPDILGTEKAEPSLIAVWFEKIMYAVVAVGLICLALFLIYMLAKRFRRIIKKVTNWISRFANQLLGQRKEEEVDQSYIDEKESIFDWDTFVAKQKDKITRAVRTIYHRKPTWQQLSTEQKIRYLYRELVKEQVNNGYVYHPSLTIRETISEIIKMVPGYEKELNVLNELYEQIKYGETVNEEVNVDQLKVLIAR